MVHNHNWEFQGVFGDRTAFDILMEHTSPRNVVFQIDLYWATNGGGIGNPVAVLDRYGNRIQLFHVKDMAGGPFPGRIEIVGEGIIDFPEGAYLVGSGLRPRSRVAEQPLDAGGAIGRLGQAGQALASRGGGATARRDGGTTRPTPRRPRTAGLRRRVGGCAVGPGW
jgi:hypothetical protein